MDGSYQIELAKTELVKSRFQNEIDYLLTRDATEEEWIPTRIAELKHILNNIEPPKEPENKDRLKANNKKIDELMYKKPWIRLQPSHRMVKIKEWIKEQYPDEDTSSILKEIEKLVYSGKLNCKRHATYDPITCTLVEFPALKEKNKDDKVTFSIKH